MSTNNEKFPTNDEGLNSMLREVAGKAMCFRPIEDGDKDTPEQDAEKFLAWHFTHRDVADPRQFQKDLLTFDTYARAAAKTESIDFPEILARVVGSD